MILRTPFLLSVMAGSLALAGCTVGPDYERPATHQLATDSLPYSDFSEVLPRTHWWSWFDDPQLTQLIQQALQSNHDIRKAQARLRKAQALLDEQDSERWPQITGSASQTRQSQQVSIAPNQRGVSEPRQVGMQVQWEIDLFGRLQRLSEAASANEQASRADLVQMRQLIAATVADAYFSYRNQQQQLQLKTQQIQSWNETVAQLHAEQHAGSGLPEESEDAQARLQRQYQEQEQLQLGLQQQLLTLKTLLDIAPDETLVMAEEHGSTPAVKTLPLAHVNEWIQQRPDVQHAEAQLRASTAYIGAATANLYPRLSLSSFLGFLSLGTQGLNAATQAYSAQGVLQWPALNLGTARAQLRAAEAEGDHALIAYQQRVLTAQQEVQSAILNITEHQKQLYRLLQSSIHIQRAADIAQTRHRAGAGSYLSVLETQRTLYDIEQQLRLEELNAQRYVVQLYKSLGWWGKDD